MRVRETEHYIFHYQPGSCAERDIDRIADDQEACLAYITSCLALMPEDKIQYSFFDTPEDVGRELERRFGQYMPLNGCTVSKNEILAVYSDKIHCIGCHEDTHIVSFQLGRPKTVFLQEGLACCMDRLWWGIDNDAWAAYYICQARCPSIKAMLDNDYFDSVPCQCSYPVAGAFVHDLIMRFGMERFLKFYASSADSWEKAAESILDCTIDKLEENFLRRISLMRYDDAVLTRIEQRLVEEKNKAESETT